MTKGYRVGGGGLIPLCVCHCAIVFYNVSVSVLVLLVYVFFSAIKNKINKKYIYIEYYFKPLCNVRDASGGLGGALVAANRLLPD